MITIEDNKKQVLGYSNKVLFERFFNETIVS